MQFTNAFRLILVSLCIYGCNQEEATSPRVGSKQDETGYITLIFAKAPVNSIHRFPTMLTGFNYEIRYVTDSLMDVFEVISDTDADTVKIETKRNFLEIQHVVDGLDEFSFLLSKGDTVIFTYDGHKPVAKRKNDPKFDVGLNYDYLKRAIVFNDTFPGFIMLKNFPTFSFLVPDPSPEKSARLFENLKRGVSRELLRERRVLDSLRALNLISDVLFSFHERKWRHEFETAPLYHLNFWLVRQKLDAAISTRVDESIISLHHDSLLYFPFYRSSFELLYLIKSRRVNRIASSNGDSPDFKSLYDSINSNTEYTRALRELLLFRAIQDIIRSSSAKEIRKYGDKFSEDISANPSFVKFVKNKFKLDDDITANLRLLTPEGQKTDLKEILKRHTGKVVYVDFWASWCSPCIRAFPSSKKLEEQFKNKDIVFIFISQDQLSKNWDKASKKHNIASENNFLIDNLFTTEFLQELRIESIPRYLIYNKSGELADQNAPGPESKQLEHILLEQLK
jgi:thiol-disulfide isomerase/thioredoxin